MMGLSSSKSVYVSQSKVNCPEEIFDCVTVCMKNMNSRGMKIENTRKSIITKFITSHSPTILFFQDFLGKGPYEKSWNGYPFPKKYMYYGNQIVSVMYDTDTIRFGDLSESSEILLEKIKLIRQRSCVFIAQDAEGKRRFIAVSWNGSISGYTTEHKMSLFIEMLSIFEEIANNEKLPVLIGGNFNVDIDMAKSFIPKQFVLYEYSGQKESNSRAHGHFLSTKDLCLSETNVTCLDKLLMQEDKTP